MHHALSAMLVMCEDAQLGLDLAGIRRVVREVTSDVACWHVRFKVWLRRLGRGDGHGRCCLDTDESQRKKS